jgi:acylphosphatase
MSDAGIMKTVRATVLGRVQGVCFRAYTHDKARELGVRGYVRNLYYDSVEIVAVGEDDAVDALMAWAAQGPPWAHVTNVVVEPLVTREEFIGFEIRH